MRAGEPGGRALEEGCRLLEEAGDRGYLSTACAILAEAYYELGRLDDAYAQTLRSEELGASDDLANEEQWREARAKVFARRGEAEQAEKLAREALEIAQQTQHPDGEALLTLGKVLELVGKPEEAARHYKAAVESFEQKGVVPLAERARERLGA